MVLKVLATADNHLDFSANQFGPKRYDRKEDFQRCFMAVIDYALRNKPDIVLLGGDVFDNPNPRNPPRSTLMRIFRELHEQGIRVIAVSGEHDTPKSLEQGASPLSVYSASGYVTFLQNFEKPESVAITSRDGEEVAVTGLSRSPFAVPGSDPLSNFAPSMRGDINILLTHYPIDGFKGYFGSDPIIRLSSVPRDFQLVVSGHLHRHQEMQSRETFLVYPGSTERADIREASEEKGFVWLELSKKGLLSSQFLPTPARPTRLLEYSIAKEGDLTMFLKAELDRLRDPGLALWLRMIGKTTPEHLKTYKRPVLQTYGEGKFFHLLIEDAWELEQDKPLDAMPRTTPLQELERYFEDQIAKAPLERKEELKEAFELARDKLKELGAW